METMLNTNPVEQIRQADQSMVDARFNEIAAQAEQERQIQATETMVAMFGIAMRMRSANPELANEVLGIGVMNYYAPQIQNSWNTQQAQMQQQQEVAARNFHAKEDDGNEE